MASKIDAPDSPKEDTIPAQGEEKPASPSSTINLPKDIRENKKIATPIIPSLNLGKNQPRVELEKQKVDQQNYIFNLNKRLGDSKGSIKRTQQYLAGLGGAYGQAQSLQGKDNASRLAESIKQAKSGLAVQDKQQKLLEHRILEAYKHLQEINDRIAHTQTHDKQSSTAADVQLTAAAGGFLLGRAIFKRKKKGDIQANVPEETTVPETPTTPGAQPATATTQPTGPIGQGIRVARWVAGSAVGVVSKTIEITGKAVQFAGKGIQAAGRVISVSLGSIPYVGIPFKALGIGLSGAGKGVEVAGKGLESFGKSLGKIRQGLKMLKSVQLLAAGTPIGAAVAIGARFKRLIAAAIAGLLYLLYLLGIKLLGMVSGLAIGLVTGAPLLLLPAPIGIPLYIGYNAYWVYRGWNDPLGTYHLATHPTELITRPASWIKNQFSRFGGAAQSGTEATLGGIGNVTSSALSATGSFITGTASTLWGGIAGTFEGAVSLGFSTIGSVMGTLAGSSGAIAGNLATVAVGGSVATVAGVTIIGTIATNSAFYTPTLDPTEQFFPPGQNEFFTITKTPNAAQIPIPDPFTPITYTITITALKETITINTFNDQISASNGSSISITVDNCAPQIPHIVVVGTPWVCTTLANATLDHANSTILNTATITISTGSGKTETSSASATVHVGSTTQTCDNFEFIDGSDPSLGSPTSWTQEEIDTINDICNSLLSQSSTLMTFIKNAPIITLERYAGGCSGSVNGGTTIRFFGCSLSIFDSAKYVFIHELAHVVGNVNTSLYNNYTNSGAYDTEGMIKTYPICPGNENESFAEMITDYVVAKTYNFPARCTGYPGGPYITFQTDYPLHYDFAENNIFGGITY